MNRKSYSLKKPSNRARLRLADLAVRHAVDLEAALESTVNARNGLHATLCSVLAQKGGEVTITPGTMAQLMETRMGFTIVPGPGDGEVTLRLVPQAPEGVYPDVSDNDDDADDGSGLGASVEEKTVIESKDLSGDSR